MLQMDRGNQWMTRGPKTQVYGESKSTRHPVISKKPHSRSRETRHFRGLPKRSYFTVSSVSDSEVVIFFPRKDLERNNLAIAHDCQSTPDVSKNGTSGNVFHFEGCWKFQPMDTRKNSIRLPSGNLT